MSIQNYPDLRLSFDENGYAILRNVFSEQETNDIRQATLQSRARRRALATGFSKAKMLLVWTILAFLSYFP